MLYRTSRLDEGGVSTLTEDIVIVSHVEDLKKAEEMTAKLARLSDRKTAAQLATLKMAHDGMKLSLLHA